MMTLADKGESKMSISAEKLRGYIDGFYKPNFEAISDNEIYKWDALQNFRRIHFLDGWYDEPEQFRVRFTDAIAALENLLNGNSYYAKSCLLDCAKAFPQETKKALSDLSYVGCSDGDVIEGMDAFEFAMRTLTAKIRDEDVYVKSFQGYRAAALLLFFMYPEKYFFYKSQEYYKMKKLIGFVPTPRLSDYENCQQMSAEILNYLRTDSELCSWYEERRAEYFGIDPEYHLLVQDVLWSTRYYKEDQPNGGRIIRASEKSRSKEKVEIIKNPSASTPSISLIPIKDIDYENEQRKRRSLGREGEHFVLRHETERLKKIFPSDESKRPVHVSEVEGDGLGYDIRSFDEKGNVVFIEVKTTTGQYSDPFYITRRELIRSETSPKEFRLYRVYHFRNGTGDIGITPGSLKKYCTCPTKYEVILKK